MSHAPSELQFLKENIPYIGNRTSPAALGPDVRAFAAQDYEYPIATESASSFRFSLKIGGPLTKCRCMIATPTTSFEATGTGTDVQKACTAWLPNIVDLSRLKGTFIRADLQTRASHFD